MVYTLIRAVNEVKLISLISYQFIFISFMLFLCLSQFLQVFKNKLSLICSTFISTINPLHSTLLIIFTASHTISYFSLFISFYSMEQKVKVYLAVFWDSEAWRALQSEWPHYFFELRNIAQPSVLLMQDCMGPATFSIIIFNYFHRGMSKLRHYSISRKRQLCLCTGLFFVCRERPIWVNPMWAEPDCPTPEGL